MFNKLANHIRQRSPSQIALSTVPTIHTACYQPTHSLPTTPNHPRLTSNNSSREPNPHNSIATLAPPSPRGFVPGRLPDAGPSQWLAHHCRRPEPFTKAVIPKRCLTSPERVCHVRLEPQAKVAVFGTERYRVKLGAAGAARLALHGALFAWSFWRSEGGWHCRSRRA